MALFTTILAGVSVFVIGQIFLKWVIEPIQQLREVISQIIYLFANDNGTIHNAIIIDKEVALSVSKELKSLGAKLISKQHLIPFYNKIYKWLKLPEEKNLLEAAKKLSSISNIMFEKGSSDIYLKLDLYRKQVCEYCLVQDPIDSYSIEELKKDLDQLKNKNITNFSF